MKRLYLMAGIICVLFFSITVIAAQVNKSATMTWTQDAESLASMADGGGWNLYVSDQLGGPYVLAKDSSDADIFIPYDGSNGTDYTSTKTLKIIGASGETVTKYFVLTAKAKNGKESTYSNEASLAIDIPMGVPFTFTIKITTQ